MACSFEVFFNGLKLSEKARAIMIGAFDIVAVLSFVYNTVVGCFQRCHFDIPLV